MSTVTQPTSARLDPEPDTPTAAWNGFVPGPWQDHTDVRDFIQRNYTPYTGDAGFLAGPTERTTALWQRLTEMFPAERAKGVYDIDANTPAMITAHAPGYIDRDHEIIVGLQTDAPLKRAIMPFGGWRMVEDALKNLRLPGRPRDQEHLHQLPQDPQRRCLRRLPARRQGRPSIEDHHRAAGRVRSGSDHR